MTHSEVIEQTTARPMLCGSKHQFHILSDLKLLPPRRLVDLGLPVLIIVATGVGQSLADQGTVSLGYPPRRVRQPVAQLADRVHVEVVVVVVRDCHSVNMRQFSYLKGKRMS